MKAHDRRSARISVLLPAHNAEATLDEALTGLVDQTLREWECLLVDDGSTDRTPEIAAAWAARDARVRVLHHRRREGIVAALQTAAAHAAASILARQDADDRSRPHRFAATLQLLASRPDLGAAACLVETSPADRVTAGLRDYCAWLNGLVTSDQIEREIWVESPLPHPATLIRREAFEACGGYRAGDRPEDYDLWLRMHLAGWRFAKVPEPLYLWRHHEHRLTFRDPRYRPAAFLACKIDHLEALLRERSVVIWGAGRDGKRLAHALIDRGLSPRAFIDIDRRKIGGRRLGLPVHPPNHLEGGPEALRPATSSASGKKPIVLAAVGTKGARGLIRARLTEMGWRERQDFLCLH